MSRTRRSNNLPALNRYELNDRRAGAVEAVKVCKAALTGSVPSGYRDQQHVIDHARKLCDQVICDNDPRQKELARVVEDTTNEDDVLLTCKETAALIGVSDQWLRKRIKAGHGHPPYTIFGSRYKFRRGAVLSYIKNREVRSKLGRPPKKKG